MIDRVLLAGLAYLAGSFPTGVVLGNLKGVDVRRIGSGNIGATNVTRALGSTFGTYTLVGDAAKGALPVIAALVIAPGAWLYVSLIGFLAVFGHCFSIFLDFGGGKGVATSAGVFLVLAPFPTLVAAGVWGAVVAVTRVSSFGALAAVPTLMIAMLIPTFDFAGLHIESPLRYLPLAFAIAAVIVVRHRANIRRAIDGVENRFEKKA